MIYLSDEHIRSVIVDVEGRLESNKIPIVHMDDYLDNYLDYCSSLKEVTYPYTINIPKPIDYMLQTGDFTPAETITIKEPLLYNGKPIWTRSSLKGVGLGFGYENSNKKELSNVYLGNVSLNSGPHFHLAGKSGGGKSVALSNLIFNILFAYSPFEVNLHLVDAKISEAARYAQDFNELVPHIKTIGATEDTGYVISILEMIAERATKLNQLFGKAGVNNIKDFREQTGLTIPRDLLIVDEYQFQYQKATQKESTQLTNKYDQFCTAGRSSGTHLTLCTQSYLPELKKALFKNMELRACLTCEPSTSEGTLGNKVASDCKFIGELYFNTSADQSVEATRMFKVPLQDENAFKRHRKFLSEIGRIYGIKAELNFFDESVVLTEQTLKDLINKYKKNRRIVLGTPAFLKSSENDIYYQDLNFDDMENILCFSPIFTDVVEMLRTMTMNYDVMDRVRNKFWFLTADKALGRSLVLPEGCRSFPIKRGNDPIVTYCFGMVYRKQAMLEADQEIFDGSNVIDAQIKARFDEYCTSANKTYMMTDLNLKRVTMYVNKLSASQNYMKMYGNPKREDLFNHAIMALEDLLNYSMDFMSSKVSPSNLPVDYVNLVGLDKINGICRGNTMSIGNIFTEVMMDAPEGNVCFVCYAANLTGVNQYKGVFKFMFTCNAKNQETKLGIELPASVSPKLIYAVNPSTSDMYRFKKLKLEGLGNGDIVRED